MVGVLLVAAQMIEAPSRTIETVKAEQLFTVVERLMDKILLTPGHPPDWGSNITVRPEALKDFGVALAGATAPYIVDPDKVMRLANLAVLPNPTPITAERVAELLHIKGQYGFRLEMKPMIRVAARVLQWNERGLASRLEVSVTNWQDVGLPNAEVNTLYVIILFKGDGAGQQELELEELVTLRGSCTTDALGRCALDFSGGLSGVNVRGRGSPSTRPSTFLVIHVSWEGFVSVAGYSPEGSEPPVEGYIIGDFIFIEKPDEAAKGAIIVKDEVVQVVPQYALLLEPIEVEWCRGDQSKEGRSKDPEWCHEVAANVMPSRPGAYLIGRIDYLERLSSHVVVFGKWRGRWRAAVLSRIPEVNLCLGPQGAQPANSASLIRIATIYNYPYIVRLTVWRWVEGWP